MNEGVSVQAHACHSGNLHDTVGRDLPKLEQVDRNLQENNSHLTRTVTLSQLLLSELQLCINPSIFLLFCGGWFDIRPDGKNCQDEWITRDLCWPHLPSLLCVYHSLPSFHCSLVFVITPPSPTHTHPKVLKTPETNIIWKDKSFFFFTLFYSCGWCWTQRCKDSGKGRSNRC